MPTRNVNLTADQDAFIEEIVSSGKYQNASEAVREALRGLQQKLREDELRLKLLRAEIGAGVEALERGAFIEIDEADLDAALDRIVS